MEFPSLEQVKAHLRTNHLVTEETCHASSIILPAKHLVPEHQVNQFARDDEEDENDENEYEDDELCVLEEIAPPRFPLEADPEEEVEVLEEIPPPPFRRKRVVSDDWRVALLRKMREMRFLPADQLAVQLRKAKEEKKKREEEEVLRSFRVAGERRRKKNKNGL